MQPGNCSGSWVERLGWVCVGSCEIDKHARKIYEANFDTADEFFWADATTLDTSTMPDFDVPVWIPFPAIFRSREKAWLRGR
jgi:site-specific DNA-cytosine methylase